MQRKVNSINLMKKASRDGLPDPIPAVDHTYNDDKNNLAIPSDDAVYEAKDWVDSNEK